MDDSEIKRLFFERSEQAITELDNKYGHIIRKTAHNILNNDLDADEIANDTYLRVWNNIPPQSPDFLAGYVCAIAHNTAVNRYHHDNAEKRCCNYSAVLDEIEECIPSGASIDTELEALELSEAINRFLSALPREDRYLFVRRYWYADSIDDLCTMTGNKANHIYVHLFRLRKKLLLALEKEGFLE